MDSEHDNSVEGPADLMESGSASAGDRLRAAREARRLELSHVAAETRIPLRHLEAIEAGAFESLPSRTYAIGFARSYARVVGLDDASIAAAVREELADGNARHSAIAGGMEPGDPAKLPSAGLAWFGGIAALILAIGLTAFFTSRSGAGNALPSLIAEQAEPDTPAAAAPPSTAAAPGADAVTGAGSGAGKVVFTATGDGAWVRFYEEGGERLFEGILKDGETYEVPLNAQDPRLNTGRPNLLKITIDGRTVPPLSEEMVPVGDAPVSATALLARTTTAPTTGPATGASGAPAGN